VHAVTGEGHCTHLLMRICRITALCDRGMKAMLIIHRIPFSLALKQRSHGSAGCMQQAACTSFASDHAPHETDHDKLNSHESRDCAMCCMAKSCHPHECACTESKGHIHNLGGWSAAKDQPGAHSIAGVQLSNLLA
jgi:hypothetical protein